MASTSVTGNLHLLVELVKRDFLGRFTGSVLGVFWAILQPLSLVTLYWFVFTKMIPRSPDAGSAAYPLFLISGILPYLGFQEGIMRATTSIVDNSAMVRRLTFRSDVLILVPNVSALLFELIGIIIFTIYLAIRGESFYWIWVLPVAMFIQFTLQTGLSLFLSTLHVFFRDVTQVLGFLLTIGFFLSPILYSGEGRYAAIFAWNPMTPLLGLFRSAVLSSPLPGAASIVFLLAVTTATFILGLSFFRRAQPTIADLL